MKQSIWFKSCAVLISCLMLWNSGYAALLVLTQESWNSMRGLSKNPYPGHQYTKSRAKVKTHPAHTSYDREARGGLWNAKTLQAYRLNRAIRAGDQGLWSMDSLLMVPENSSTSGSEFPWEGTNDGVNTATGNKMISLSLIDWPSRGSLQIDVTLYHSSSETPSVRPYMQSNWSHNYDIKLETVVDSGSEYAFVYWGDGTVYPYGALSSGLYARPTGIFDDLTTTGSGGSKTWTLTTKNQWKYLFNNHGCCTSIKDRWGHTITINWGSYTVSGNTVYRVTSVSDPDSRTVEFTYNGTTNYLSQISDKADSQSPRNFTISESGGNLTQVTWPTLNGGTPTHTFGYSGVSLVTETNRRGKATTYAYTGGVLTSETTPLGLVTSYAYDTPDDGQTTITLPKPTGSPARELVHTYTDGLLTQEEDERGNTDDYEYNANNLVSSHNDRNGNGHLRSYDSNGNAVDTIDGLMDFHCEITYNATNDVTSVINGEGIKTVMEYYGANDSNGPEGALKLVKTRLTTSPETFQTRKSFTYYTGSGDKGQLKTIKDGLNRTTTLTYTTRGEIDTITKPDGSETNFSAYGPHSNLTTLVDAAGITTTLGYDNWYRQTTAAQGNSTVTTGFLNDDLVQTRTLSGSDLPQSNANQATSYTYDDGRLLTKTNAKGEEENYSYTYSSAASPFLHSIENGRHKTRTYGYDVAGQVVLLAHADGLEEAWSYDAEDNVTYYESGSENTDGISISYAYDELNELVAVDYPSGTDTEFAYDFAGRMTSMIDASGTTTWEYFKTNLVKKMTAPNGNVEYTYNDADQLYTTVTGEGTTTNGYDTYGRPTTVQNPASETTTWDYDAYGRVNKQTFSTGAYESYGYDSRGRMNSVTVKNNSNSTLESQSMVYDDASNMKSRTHNGVQTDYTYDKINQILTEQHGTSGQASYFRDEYTYDGNGNRTQKVEKRGATPTVTTHNYTYNDSDRMTNYDGTSISYNGLGNPETWVVDKPGGGRGVVNLAYDYEGRVTSMTVPGQGSAYQTNTYNGLGARVKVVDNGYGSGTRKYVRGGAGVTDPVLRMTTGADNSPTWTNYTPGVSERTPGTSKFNHSGIKNVDAQSASNQTVSATREYDAFGNVTSSTGSQTGRFGYGGAYGYQEDEGGLKQLGHRLYDPVIGRFVTNDWSRDGRNWFSYCANNPLLFGDPRGLWKIIVAMNPGAQGHGSHALIGLWDEDPRHPIMWFGFYGDGTVYTGDNPDDHAKFVEITVSKSQYLGLKKRLFGKVHAAQRGIKEDKYSLLSNNCAQFIFDLLIEMGIVSSAESGSIRDPKDLIDALEGAGSSYNGVANLPVRLPWTGARPHPAPGGSSGTRK